MALSDDKKLEILNDHYKDTFSHIRNAIKTRDRLFFYLLLVLTIMYFQMVSPSEFDNAISKFISQKLNGVTLNITFIRGMIWFVLLSIVLRYCQTVVGIERQYSYIHKLEKELTKFYPSEVTFTREGVSYLKNYPRLSDWAHILYTWVFPVFLLATITAKIYIEFPSQKQTSPDNNQLHFVVWGASLVFGLMVWITIGFYLYFRFQQSRTQQNEA
ncbi:hypothetical protein H8E77_12925 [bacterium]|nr:hypothetical protein [bacterium]